MLRNKYFIPDSIIILLLLISLILNKIARNLLIWTDERKKKKANYENTIYRLLYCYLGTIITQRYTSYSSAFIHNFKQFVNWPYFCDHSTNGFFFLTFPFHNQNYKIIHDESTLSVLCISESCTEIKIKLNFYFHTPLWCLKMFYEGL